MAEEPGRQIADAQKHAEHRPEESTTEISDQPSDLEINDVAKRLLRWKFLLSALEVHTELCERGRELPLLRDFFSNPGNFETNARHDGISISGISTLLLIRVVFNAWIFGVMPSHSSQQNNKYF